ncbi:MAG: hypothetical protein WKF83_08260 [Nocardioidaceae bacterium]
MIKPPGVAETLDWAGALHQLGRAELDLESAAATPRRGAASTARTPNEFAVALDRLLAS